MERLDLCTNCGGTLVFENGRYVCPFCNAEYGDIPGLPNIKSIFDKAEEHLAEHDFDFAYKTFKNIIDNFDPDGRNKRKALFGLICADYGVIYDVNDKPSVYKTFQNYKLSDDENVKTLLEISFGDELDEYNEKIKELESIRQEYIEKYKDINYDIFICGKSYDENKNKTLEYSWGDKIYNELRKEGLDVFFAPNSLASSKGNYEPAIYRAIESAEYMILVASSIENINDNLIKNEWSRFLYLKNREHNRHYKVITTDEMAPKVPTFLREERDWNIVYNDNPEWIGTIKNSIEKTLHMSFDELRKDRRKPLFEFIDIKSIERKKNKEIEGYKTFDIKKERKDIIHNPYINSVLIQELDKTNTKFDDFNINLAKSYISEGNFVKAKKEMRNYHQNIDEDAEDNFDALKVQLLIESESKDYDYFFNKKIYVFDDFDLFGKLIKKLPAEEADELLPRLKNYIIDSIEIGREDNSLKFYELIYNIDSPIIEQLNRMIIKRLGNVYSQPDVTLTYIKYALPLISVKNEERFSQNCVFLIKDLCKNELWDIAKEVLRILNEVEDNYENKYFEFLIKYKAHNTDDLLDKIEEKDYYYDFGDIIKTYLAYGDDTMINEVKKRIEKKLYENRQFARINKWITVIASFNFDGREDYFKELVNMCRDDSDSYDMFRASIKAFCLNKDFYIKSCINYIRNILIKNEKYAPAKTLCEEVLQYDQYNTDLLRLYLFSLLEDRSKTFEKIYCLKVEYLQVIESLLYSLDNVDSRERLLIDLLKAYQNYMDSLNENELRDKDEIFKLIDKLLRYIKKPTDETKEIVLHFANICCEKGLFEIAEWYYIGLLGWNNEYGLAYWGLILAESKCRNEEELIKCSTITSHYDEYLKRAFSYAKYDDSLKKHYINIRDEREKYQKKHRPFRIIIIAGICIVLVVTSLLIWYFTKK